MRYLWLCVLCICTGCQCFTTRVRSSSSLGPGVRGIVGDGKTDVTAATQAALDKLGKAGGGTLYLGRGNFLFRGHLN
ncbi:MAG TPA: hypothetical protein VG722_04770, partial [Tepidisphaeraceae bacterium]|nr:hypothetical protein [Tepidisphaeraceae bacterium]